MTVLVLRPWQRLDRRPVAASGVIAAFFALMLAFVVPRGGDAAAHLYRTFLVQHGAYIWDNLWYAGQYPLASYSLLYYLPAAVFGNTLLAAGAVICSAVLFASLLLRVWGRVARIPAYCFAALAGGQFFTGDYPYTFGFAALLGTLVALERRRHFVAIVCAAITLGCSPLAFLLLCVALAAILLRSKRPRWREVLFGFPLLLLAGVEFTALSLFPSPHLIYPFTVWRLALGVPVGLLGLALSLRSRAARPLASLFAVWTLATIASYIVPSPVGHNLLRPETLVFPIMLLAALLADFKPRWLAITALAAAFAANVLPYTTSVLARGDKAAQASYWAPLLQYVSRHSTASYRLEVVPTVNHWESYYVPKAGLAIARGWYQQLDTGENPLLYKSSLSGADYRAWLRSVGVRYVVVVRTTPAPEGVVERRLLLSGRSGLRRVFTSPSGTIFALAKPTPIFTGPARAAIRSDTFDAITGWVSRPGNYLLRVHYTPYWKIKAGALCLRRAPNDMTSVVARRAGAFSLQANEDAASIISNAFEDHDTPACG